MRFILFGLLLAVLQTSLPVAFAAGDGASLVHDPAVHSGAGLSKELVAGITEADFLRLGSESMTVKIVLVASFNGENSGMNFNGHSRGTATYTIPLGWKVEVTFINPSPVPHSAVVVEREMLRKMQVGDPAFAGAAIPSPVTGISSGKATFTFLASEPGPYAFACGIPNHAIGGHWIGLEVSAKVAKPALTLGKSPPVEAR